MALKGRIEEFGLADLLQLIVQGGKSGTIALSDDVDEVQLAIQDRWILRAENASRPQESELASRLATVGVIDGTTLGKVLRLHAETEEKMARILVEGGYAELHVVRQFATLQALDTIFEAFLWPSGSYEFEEGELGPPAPWMEPIGMDYILMRGIELVVEWAGINALIPSQSARVARVRDLPPRPHGAHAALVADLELPEAEPAEGGIGDPERALFELCRPGNHVKTVLDRLPLSRFEASRALANLIKGGFVRLE